MPEDDDRGTVTRWPVWVAGVAAAMAALFMIVAVAGWRFADGDASDARAQVAAVEQRSARQAGDLRAADEATADAEARAEVLSGLIQPGMADELGGVYLRLAVAACADPEAETAAVIEQVASEASAASATLASHPGWEQALDGGAVAEAVANCVSDGG